eukprot:jgi/Tetstr1/447157/TSEL_034594.t1
MVASASRGRVGAAAARSARLVLAVLVCVLGLSQTCVVLVPTGVTCDAVSGSIVIISVIYEGLTGTLPANISDLVHLTELDLQGNLLTSTLPQNISALTSLQILNMYGNSLTGSIHEGMTELTALQNLNLRSNNLTGTIPKHLTALAHLHNFDIQQNSITGSIPEGLSALTALQYINMQDNGLTGSMPQSLTQLPQLQTLWLSENQLSGTLPANWSSLVIMDSMGLNSNTLAGTIPDQWTSMAALTSLNVQSNCLTGGVPASFGASPSVVVTYDVQHDASFCPAADTGGTRSYDPFDGNNAFVYLLKAQVMVASTCSGGTASCAVLPLTSAETAVFTHDLQTATGLASSGDIEAVATYNDASGAELQATVSFQYPFDEVPFMQHISTLMRSLFSADGATAMFPTFFDRSTYYEGVLLDMVVLTETATPVSISFAASIPSDAATSNGTTNGTYLASFEADMQAYLSTLFPAVDPAATVSVPSVTVTSDDTAIQYLSEQIAISMLGKEACDVAAALGDPAVLSAYSRTDSSPNTCAHPSPNHCGTHTQAHSSPYHRSPHSRAYPGAHNCSTHPGAYRGAYSRPHSSSDSSPHSSANPSPNRSPHSSPHPSPHPSACPRPHSSSDSSPHSSANPSPDSKSDSSPNPSAYPRPHPSAYPRPHSSSDSSPHSSAYPRPHSSSDSSAYPSPHYCCARVGPYDHITIPDHLASGHHGGASHNSDLSPANQRPANYSGSHCDSLDACHVLVATDHHPTGDNLSADRNRNARADITDSHCNQHAAPTVNHRSRACDHHSGAADIHAACLASRHHRPGSSADNHCAAINAVVDHHCAAGNNGYFADHRSGDRGNHNTRSPPHAHPSPAFQPTYPSLRDPRFSRLPAGPTTTAPPTLQVSIKGAASVAAGRSFSLNAVRARADSSAAASFAWSCVARAGTGGCGSLRLGDSALHLIPGSALEPGVYEFTVFVAQGGQSAQATLTVEVAAPPAGGAISMSCIGAACAYPDRPVSAAQPLHLQVDAPVGVDRESLTVKWSWDAAPAAMEDFAVLGAGGWQAEVSPAGLQLAGRHTFRVALLDTASGEPVATLERSVAVDQPPACTASGGACFQVSPSTGFSGGETAFRAVASGWVGNLATGQPESLRLRFGVCEVFECADGRVTWASELLEAQDGARFDFALLPAGDPEHGNRTTVRLCAVKLLGGEVVTSQTCTQQDVAVTRPERYALFTGSVLANALQSPTLRLQAVAIAAEQIAAAQVEGGAAVASHEEVMSPVVDMMSAEVLTDAVMSSCMSAIRQLASSGGDGEAPVLGGAMIDALAAGAARLLDVSGGDFSRTLELGEDLLGAMLSVLSAGDLSGLQPGDSAEASVRRAAEALEFTATALLEGMPVSPDPRDVGPPELRMKLFKGDTGDVLFRQLEMAGAGTQDVGRRRHLLDASVVGSRVDAAEVSLQGFTGPGCDISTENYHTPDCTPRAASLSLWYTADSSYVRLGLGEAEFRRAVTSSTDFPLSDRHRVHTASGVISVRGSTGLLVPMLAIQLPLDLQTGLGDLRADNKFCARLDYVNMTLVFVGPVEVATVVNQSPNGYSVENHHALCWADMYADFVVVQVSLPVSTARRADYVSPRHDAAPPALQTQRWAPASTPSTRWVVPFGVFTGVLLMGMVVVAGLCDGRNWQPMRRLLRGGAAGEPAPVRSERDTWGELSHFSHALKLSRSVSTTPPSVTCLRRLPVATPSMKLDVLYTSSSKTLPAVPGSSGRGTPSWREMTRTWHQATPAYEPLGSDCDTPSSTSSDHFPAGVLAPSTTQLPQMERHHTVKGPEADTDVGRLFAIIDDPAALANALTSVADLNGVDANGRTALHVAARAGLPHSVKVLLRHVGAGPEQVALNLRDMRGQAPLHLAAAYGHLQVVGALLARSRGAHMVVMDVDCLECSDSGDLRTMPPETAPEPGAPARREEYVQVNQTDSHGCTALHLAAHFGRVDVVDALLKAGAHHALAMQDTFGNSPLHHAAMQGHTDVLLSMLRVCLEEDSAPECVLCKNSRGQVPIDVATIHGHSDAVDALLLWGEHKRINVSRPYGDGPSVMSLATFNGRRRVTQIFRQNEWWLWEEAAPEEVALGEEAVPAFERLASVVSDGAQWLSSSVANGPIMATLKKAKSRHSS